MPATQLNVRLEQEDQQRLADLAVAFAESRTNVVRRLVRDAHAQFGGKGPALLVEDLREQNGDKARLRFFVADADACKVEATAMRADGTASRLDRQVNVQARPEPDGRLVIELVGFNYTPLAGVGLYVATLPRRTGVEIVVDLDGFTAGLTVG